MLPTLSGSWSEGRSSRIISLMWLPIRASWISPLPSLSLTNLPSWTSNSLMKLFNDEENAIQDPEEWQRRSKAVWCFGQVMFSIEIKLSHQLYSLAQFIIPRGENFDTNFLCKVRWAEAEMEEDTYSNFYIQAHLCHERGSFHHQM